LPASRRRGMLMGMAKPLAKLLSMLTPQRRWAQFNLATMFIVDAELYFACAWLASQVNRAKKQSDAVTAIEAMGGAVRYGQFDKARTMAFPMRSLRR